MRAPAAALRGAIDEWFRRRTPVGAESMPLAYRRVYILPTRNGWLFGALLLVMWLGAVNYSNSMAFLLTFLLAGLGNASILHTFRNLVSLRVSAGRCEPVFAGQTAAFPIQLYNPGRRERLSIGVKAGGSIHDHTDIAADGEGTLYVRRATRHRGRLALGRLNVLTRYPTGLFVAWSPVQPVAHCLVYPAPETGPVPEPPPATGQGQGNRQDEGDDDFGGLRRYRAGDPIRHIAWKSSHDKELQTKTFVGEAASRLWLDYDALADLGTEARLSRLCRWLLDADRDQRPVGLRLPGVEIPPGRGEAHLSRCLEALAVFEG